MLDRLVEEKEPVSAEIILSSKVDNLTNSEWKLAEGYRIILMPFEQASQDFCGKHYPTLSMKIPALSSLARHFKNSLMIPFTGKVALHLLEN